MKSSVSNELIDKIRYRYSRMVDVSYLTLSKSEVKQLVDHFECYNTNPKDLPSDV